MPCFFAGFTVLSRSSKMLLKVSHSCTSRVMTPPDRQAGNLRLLRPKFTGTNCIQTKGTLTLHSCLLPSRSGHPIRWTSSVADLEDQVSQLENAARNQGISAYEVETHVWPTMRQCATSIEKHQHSSVGKDSRLAAAQLSIRLMEVCLQSAEARRVHLWEWSTGDPPPDDPFSPSKYWDEAPHPTKEMFNQSISCWKQVIQSCSAFSVKSRDAMQMMESAARQCSSMLNLMEEEYASDLAFVDAFNSKFDSSQRIRSGAAIPDVRIYSEVISAWAHCIDGSVFRSSNKRSRFRDDAFQNRLHLEATALKSMMELLESMEEDLYGAFSSSEEPAPADRKRPPPDRVCYNIILTAMARQINPSLYEMRLVLQRMMERVQFELGREDDNPDLDGEELHLRAMEFFPDAFSYNALIEARANRSRMFASDGTIENKSQAFHHRPRHHAMWEVGQNALMPKKRRKFSSSEEESILAEQTLMEMGRLVTMPVRPNIYSYNGVIKSWCNAGSARALQCAVLLLVELAKNGLQHDETFTRIVQQSSSLLDKGVSQPKVNKTNSSRKSKPATPLALFAGVGIAGRMGYIQLERPAPANDSCKQYAEDNDESEREPMGLLTEIEIDVFPDLKSFQLVLNALEQQAMPKFELMQQILAMLEKHHSHLADISVYMFALKALAKVAKETDDPQSSLAAAQHASTLLSRLVYGASEDGTKLPRPTEHTFLLATNAWSNAAAKGLSSGIENAGDFAACEMEKLLLKLEAQKFEAGDGSIACYGAAVRTWASLGKSARAETLLEKIAQVSRGQPLDVIYFNAILDAWARELSSTTDSDRARERLENMHGMLCKMEGPSPFNVEPDASSFNQVIRACSAPWTKSTTWSDALNRGRALDIANDAYSKMKAVSRPDAHTYVHMFRALSCLLPPAGTSDEVALHRLQAYKTVFHSCCIDGQVTKTGMWTMKKGAGGEGFFDLLTEELNGTSPSLTRDQLERASEWELISLLPHEWTRNGKRYKRLNKRS